MDFVSEINVYIIIIIMSSTVFDDFFLTIYFLNIYTS